jgi:hypothetical protein
MGTPEAREQPSRRRRAGLRSLRHLLMPAPLAAAAVVTGGVAGVILGFAAALLLVNRLLDRVLGVTGASKIEAEHAFRRLARERRLAGLDRRMHHRPEDGDRLAYLAMDSGWAALAQRHARGMQPITLASIVGSVDQHKAVSFDRSFRPPDWSRGRWTLMYLAARRGSELPPISVYRVGDEHFVQDGHHRVSVARALGAASVEAHVVELIPASDAQRRRGRS